MLLYSHSFLCGYRQYVQFLITLKMVKCGTGFRKQASKRRRSICRKKLHLPKKGSNHHVSSEVDEIADNSIVDINLNIVVGDEAVPGPSSSWFAKQSRGSFQYSCH